MVERAGAREIVEIPVASHAVPVSYADAVADVILGAAKSLEATPPGNGAVR
jgi:hypothetical protein